MLSKINSRWRKLWRGHCRRSNVLDAQKVNVGIVFNNMLGGEEAALYLSKNGIPEAVTSRVLDHTRQRRKNDVPPLLSNAPGGENAN